jgi:hypothetical protein
MGIDTFISSIGTFPKPTIKVFLDCIDEVCASNICSPFWLALSISRVCVNVNLGRFSLEVQIV